MEFQATIPYLDPESQILKPVPLRASVESNMQLVLATREHVRGGASSG